MKRILATVMAATLGACAVVQVDESTVFAPVAFDAALSASTGEVIDGERGFASEDVWKKAWAGRIGRGSLASPAPAFAGARIEHGVLEGGLAWSMVSREGGGRPLVVRCGGNASTRQRNGFVHAVTAIDHGDVLLFDYPGSGQTGGEVSTERFLRMMDSLEAVVHSRAAGRRLVMWGHSLGGFVCSELARRLPETDGVILEATARNAAEVAKAWTPWYAGPFVHVSIAPGLNAYDNANALKGFKGPVLVIGARQDATLPVQLARSMDKALKEQGADVTYVEFKAGGHSSLAGQAGFGPAIGAFFARLAPPA
jgi:pimeloyl-ACP methyl ester carboxylesterase